MTERGPNHKAQTPTTLLRVLTLDFGFFRRSVALRAIIAVLAAMGVAAAIFVLIGGVDVSADKPDGWVVRHLLHFVFKRSVGSGANRVDLPDDFATPARVRLAAQHFDMVCSNCHGSPGFGQSVVALSMSPRPQYLPKVVGQFTDAELYVIVEHGVKFSAMPSWPTDARGDEVWSMVAFLRRLPKLDAKAYHELTALPETGRSGPMGFGGDPSLRPANPLRETPPFNEFQYAAPASGFSDQGFHENPYATCARCHGADGSGAVTGGEAPNLTIQNAAYLRASLEAYISGTRKSGFMQNIAAQLTEPQIADLASHYANMPLPTAPSPRSDPALVQRGETIANEGIRTSAIPPCADCHESSGQTITGAPHLAGQAATYLRRELDAIRHGGRGASVWWNPMPAVAHDLGDKDIAAVAAYYSGLPPARAAVGGQAAPPKETLAGGALASGIGEAKGIFATRCMKCHVNGGRGDVEGNYPDLTIQSKAYAAQSLYAFRTHMRPNDKMQDVTKDLTFDQMTNLADYIDRLTPRLALTKFDRAAALRGAAIAMNGAAPRGVPACLGCHGAKGVAALPLIPRLQGQSVAYLVRRLDNFTKRYDVNTNALNPMPTIAGRLTYRERADLAAYFAAAAPLQKTSTRP